MIYRGYNVKDSTWVQGFYTEHSGKHFITKLPEHRMFEVHPMSIGFSHEIFDVYNQPIFASVRINGKLTLGGDEVLIRIPEIETQTHTGNNIPNGSYTEPIGVHIKELIDDVVFDKGVIRLANEEVPLVWNDQKWTVESVQEAITITKFPWDDKDSQFEFDSDVYFLIEEAEVTSQEDLLEYLSGIRVTSKQWDLPENNFVTSILIAEYLISKFEQQHSKKPNSIEMSEKTIDSFVAQSVLTKNINAENFRDTTLKGILIKLNNNLEFNKFIINE